MRITVDTNVLISATFWYGDSNKIIELVENGKVELILSEDIISEYVRVLDYEEIQDKIKNKNLEMRYSVERIISLSIITVIEEKINIIKEDTDDNKVLECAINGKVDFIVTQDNHLLKLKEFRGIRILSSKEFLNELNKYH